ncbi:MAG TPA: alpha-hydroxy-acid oxidizing protein [Nocardioidaceae bacterium]|nr:alpha-hydroxy-acid oxidizing protein [Nocardioidaceae bacterium]
MDRWADSLEQLAREVLPAPVHRYFRQGAGAGVTASEAVAAWDRHRFLPRVLRDVTTVTTAVRLLGTTYAAPFAIAPTTLQRAAHPEGEVAMARAAAATGTLMVVASNAGSSFADIAATGVDWWLQVYVPEDRPVCRPLLERAVDAGARAVVLTADSPVVSTRYDGGEESVWASVDPTWLRVNFTEGDGNGPAHEKAADLGPQDVDWLHAVTGLPVVVKGVLRPDDARRCVGAGAAGVWVSNHGGRQLDLAADTAACLPRVAGAVGNNAEVYVDGGVRTGRHALTAAALGARAAFLGRLPLYALAVAGEEGVTRLLLDLRAELEECLRLTGCASPSVVPPDLLD